MSAIACIYNSNKEPVAIEHIDRMMGSLQKFPADDIQVWHKEHIFLGCHAQWITPESVGEQLPYCDRERQMTITADAIIDNRDELFDLLQVESDRRKTMPDSKLILLAYCKWGEDCPKYLIGDFAFIILDEKEERLFCVRDFSGNRTLYYSQHEDKFIFCTTIKPFFSLPYVQKRLNELWIAQYLAIEAMYETVEPSITPYSGIQQIPPGHFLSVKNGKSRMIRYIKVTTGKKLNLKRDEEYEEAFQEIFQRAVVDRIRTHRPVGAQLSGGLDSGSVVSFTAKALKVENKQLHTYSYVPLKNFEDWTPKNRIADERPYIKETIQYVGNIKEKFMDFEGKSPYTEIDDWLDIYEMPYKFCENSYWMKGVYEEAARDHLGIILYGARGNWSISWGPALDFQANLLKKMKFISFYKEINKYSNNIVADKSRVMAIVKKKAFPRFFREKRETNQIKFPSLINPKFAERTRVNEILEQYNMADFSKILNIYEIRKNHFENPIYWNINGTTGTKLSLRHKLWDRDPTNDLRVIQFCLSVPEEQCVHNGIDRFLIRRATKGYLPEKVRLNQKVRGIQGTDGIVRMESHWDTFIKELKNIIQDEYLGSYLNVNSIVESISVSESIPESSFIFNPNFKTLIRSIVVSRFLKTFN